MVEWEQGGVERECRGYTNEGEISARVKTRIKGSKICFQFKVYSYVTFVDY